MEGAAISACEREVQWEQGLTLLHKMCDTDVADNVISLNAANSLVAGSSLAPQEFHHMVVALVRDLRER